ncbi:MAG: hypothetical protein J6W80_03370 [Kiritimatiellae bacterium]|nr:hypothetical protein [Kiritimatiellia bacterium]
MTKDLENTLVELGPEYAGLVGRLRAAYETEGRRPQAAPRRLLFLRLFVAACLVVACGVVFLKHEAPSPRLFTSSPYTLALTSSIRAIIASQKPDGSWGNDYLTRQNAAALRAADSSGVPYKKALRYLKSKGLSPISAEELSSRILLANN